ncbi:MAG: alpha/beta hydrolase [Chitinophagales bacterium]|nr:alpha/beta hydrolase [Bacteroidota bacterium]MBP8915107.1 alpha/beta hydrolase [Chitinophagales bacterium]MBP9219800.1 alpha/beta hydrolase [Chitinophagales bacterium]MBP9795177.1 alpha/beta hydrolase [Chitinophagales bacterium]
MPITDSGYLNFKHSKIHYIRFGTGPKLLFAFHGFSENAESFLVLEPALGKKYSVIAIDLPYHGNSKWNEPDFFTTDDLINLFRQFIDIFKVDRFSILGFSMGGKCALYISKNFSSQIDELILMASDGIRTNKLYNVAVYPKWGRQLFRTTIKYPGWFFGFINITRKLNLISPWLYKFTYNHMETREKRQRLYDTWISMGTFNPDIDLVKEKLNEYKIPVFLFFGLRDEVIPIEVAEYFAKDLLRCKLTKLDRGHYFIDERLLPFLETSLQSPMD